MNFEPDISDDCLLVDGTETVTIDVAYPSRYGGIHLLQAQRLVCE